MVFSAGFHPTELGEQEGDMQDDLRYWVGFHRIQGIGAVRLRNLLDAFGDLEKAWNATPAQLRKAGLNLELAESVQQMRNTLDLDAALEQIRSSGYHVVKLSDPEYPERLKQVASPPILLFL
jgi:DNA processing protein